MAEVFLDDYNFESEVLMSDLPVLVDFWAPWCGPCRMLAPTVDAVAQEYEGRVVVAKCNVDDADEVAMQFRIRNIPTLLFFKGGEMVKFLAANVTFGSPLDGLVGDCVLDMPGALQFYALEVPATGRLVFDPAVSELHSVSAPNFAPGAKFARSR